MEYEFFRDVTGIYRARFSMGHEAVGRWLLEELGTDKEKLAKLEHALTYLNSQPYGEIALPGRDYSLHLTHEEAEFKANVLNIEGDDLDDLCYYDEEQLAYCGFEDFLTLLDSWCEFTGLVRNQTPN